GHLIVSVVGTLPTGKKAVDSAAVPVLSALGTELLNFTAPSFGTGGGVTGGFATAFKLGERWAGGLGGSYRWHASYTPVVASGELEPGGEGRVRLGVEGPLGGGGSGGGAGAYFRGAVVYAASGADTVIAGSRCWAGWCVPAWTFGTAPAARSPCWSKARWRSGVWRTTAARYRSWGRGPSCCWSGRGEPAPAGRRCATRRHAGVCRVGRAGSR